MYNLIVGSHPSPFSQESVGSATIASSRVLGFTKDEIKNSLRQDQDWRMILSKLQKYDCIFMDDLGHNPSSKIVRIGNVTDFKILGNQRSPEIEISFSFNAALPEFTVEYIKNIAEQLDICSRAFVSTHWAVNDVNLFKALFSDLLGKAPKPTLFKLPKLNINLEDKIAVMMPFDTKFNGVYSAIQAAAAEAEYDCKRVDEIWKHDVIMQEIASLIGTSKIIVCDCTGRNPNVFYEMGIAHTLGRQSIHITQNKDDIPFDIRHLKYLHYLNNKQGLETLKTELVKRIKTISSQG